ncbi:MAG: BamA/TamA family outer membrane protein [Ignavibacteria bacterium]|nr:BamA/TamA family outer membrane protein [Ignavibacteria bacterium]
MERFLKYLLLFLFLSSQAIYSQFYYFGRNKVQYEKFDWKILRTEHFDIYYYDEMLDLAEIGADYAEEVYNELKVKMNHVVTRRIPLIFYNTHLHFQQTNTTPGFIPEGVGGFFEFIKGRVVIPSMGSLNDFRHVIRHELVHVFMTNKIYRVLVDHREPADVLPPLWFVEGLAEYMSTEVDAQAEMVMRDAILNNYFVGIDDIYNIYGTFLMYKEGQNFLEFVEENYGKEKVPLMLENFWMFSNFNKVIEHTIGKEIEEIDSEWLYYLKKKYYPMMENRVPLENASKKITKEGFNFSPVYYENEGERYIYFVANRNGYSSLYKLELDENMIAADDPELVLQGERSEELEAFHLFQSSIDISKDGLITFVTKKGATDAIHLFSVSRNEIIKTFQFDHLINLTSPKFSPGRDKIVFHAVDQKGYSDIFLIDIESSSLSRLTNDYYDDRDPSFGLDKNQILFSSDRTSGEFEKKYNIFSFDLSTNKIEYVTYLNSNNSSPILSPDKKKILFTSDADGVRNIWSLEVSRPDTVEKITNFVTSAFYPAFINDSTIIFSGFERFSFNLYKDELDKTEEDTILIAMTFPLTAEKWKAGMVAGDVKREKLKYVNEYTLDYAQSQVSTDPIFGTRGGAILSLSDLLGNDNYFFLIYNTADVQSDFLKSFNIAIQRVNLSERTNYGYGVFHFSGRRYDIRDSDEYFFERSFGGFFALHFPLSKFHRLETSVTVANSDKQVISGVIERKALLISNSLSYVIDNSLWGWTGPLDGIRGRLLLGYTSDVKYSNVNYFTVIADYRHYFRLGLRSALAFRSALFYNEGKEARRYFMGGSWDLRGWRRWSIRGEKLWLSSVELRFPLVDQLYIKFPFFGLGFVGFRGAVFFDAGGAWDEEYRQTLGSFGGGLRLNLFGVLVLRYDMGKKIEDNFTRIQDGLFYQFFFGWDF